MTMLYVAPAINLHIAATMLQIANTQVSGYGRPAFNQHILHVRSQTLARNIRLSSETRELISRYSKQCAQIGVSRFGSAAINELIENVQAIPDPPSAAHGLTPPTTEEIRFGATLLEAHIPSDEWWIWTAEQVFGALGVWWGYTSPYTLDVIQERAQMKDLAKPKTSVFEVLKSGVRERQGITLSMLYEGAKKVYDEYGDDVVTWTKGRKLFKIGRVINRAGSTIYRNIHTEPFLLTGLEELDPRLMLLFQPRKPASMNKRGRFPGG